SMKKSLLILFISTIACVKNGIAQTGSFSVFIYQPPEFFTKTNLSSRLQFNLTNNDTSFCIITLYKSQPAKDSVIHDVKGQWTEYVLNQLSKADKKPARIYTQQMWDGWVSTVAIGNFYQGKKCVVMLNSFRKRFTTACVVYAFSDKSFKGVIDKFSKNLHLLK
ncbi:MAG TPA: hypothetical protein VIV35_01080, partial [Chitinophagaceae bacterium]